MFICFNREKSDNVERIVEELDWNLKWTCKFVLRCEIFSVLKWLPIGGLWHPVPALKVDWLSHSKFKMDYMTEMLALDE